MTRGQLRVAGQWRYPVLRKGLSAAWVPALGPTGRTLFDESGYDAHGALEAAVSWSTEGTTHAGNATSQIAMQGSRVYCTSGLPFSIFARIKPTYTPATNEICTLRSSTTDPLSFGVSIASSNPGIYWAAAAGWRPASASSFWYSACGNLSDRFHTVGLAYNGGDIGLAASYAAYLDGAVGGATAEGTSGYYDYSQATTFGGVNGTNVYYGGTISAVYVWSRLLTPGDFALLHRDYFSPLRKQAIFSSASFKSRARAIPCIIGGGVAVGRVF